VARGMRVDQRAPGHGANGAGRASAGIQENQVTSGASRSQGEVGQSERGCALGGIGDRFFPAHLLPGRPGGSKCFRCQPGM
jgi:hypothetical protein